MDERIAGRTEYPDRSSVWTEKGFLSALKILLDDTNPLYQSLIGRLEDYPQLYQVLYSLLFTGKLIPYMVMNKYIEVAAMFGFIKNVNGTVVISNRIFESVLYNWLMSEEYVSSKIYDTGRKYFMLFLRPIINGTGNCYVEAETRNRKRMDLVIDYRGEQYICELKIWHGNAYNERGEEQLAAYRDYFHLKKGYMLSFNFNKKKEIGVKEIILGDRLLIEATV